MSEPTMPEMFQRLADKTGEWAQANPGVVTDYELHSDRELTGTDESGRVTVTMRDFKIVSISYDQNWFHDFDRQADNVAKATVEAVNAVWEAYWQAEAEDAANSAIPMAEVHAGLRELSADFAAAYDKVSHIGEAR